MKPIYEYPKMSNQPLQKPFFPECCPHETEQSRAKLQPCFRKQKKFITLSKDICLRGERKDRKRKEKVEKVEVKSVRK